MSSDTLYCLAEHTCVEPLVGRWSAWPHVMAPVPFSLHLTNYQMKLLQSYLNNPDLHEKSCRNPRLLGGAFVDLPAGRASEARELLHTMEETLQDNIAFAKALTDFHNRIVREVKGESLEPYYRQLPLPLQGYVELVYDYYDRPIVRCLEGLLYNSGCYKHKLQSFHLFCQQHDDSRPYYMSTPRFCEDHAIDWKGPFNDVRVDNLFRLDCHPKALGEIRELLDLTPKDDFGLMRLLREAEPQADTRWQGPGIRLRYFGHACVLLESSNVSILIDPLIALKPEGSAIDRFSYADLPLRIDYVLITHGHHDHFVIEALLRLRHRIGTVVVPKNSGLLFGDVSLRLLAEKLGFKDVREVDCLDEIPIPGGQIIAVPFLGENNDLPNAKSAYIVRIGTRTALFAADSNCLDAMMYRHVRRIIGPVEMVFVGMECIGAPLAWVYGPILPAKPSHHHSQERRSNGCNVSTALQLVRAVQCRRVFVYALGREPWVRYLMALNPTDDDVYMAETAKFIRHLDAEDGIKAERLFGKAEMFI